MRLKALLLHITDRQLTVATGIGLARVAGFLTGAVVARALGPVRFAAYSVAFTMFSSLVPLSSFADTWMVSRWDDHDRLAIGRTVWLIKIGIATLLLTAAVAVSWWVPQWLTRLGIDGPLLITAVLAAGAGALTTTAASWYQAHQQFRGYALLTALPSVLALGAAAALRWMHVPNVFPYAFTLAVAYLPSAALAYKFLRHGVVRPSVGRDFTREALTFGGWVTVGSLAYVVFQRVDVFLLASTATPQEVGLYSAAVRLSMIGALFGSTLTTVWMPVGSRPATWLQPSARQRYVRESVVSVTIATLLLGLVIIGANVVTDVVFGGSFAAAGALSRILLLAQIILIAQMPFYFAMYALGGGRWIAGLGVSQAFAATVAGFWLIQRYHSAGAAWSNVLTYLIGAVGVGLFHVTRAGKGS
jgi:O-antigen/teichoic acid export membrane protein